MAGAAARCRTRVPAFCPATCLKSSHEGSRAALAQPHVESSTRARPARRSYSLERPYARAPKLSSSVASAVDADVHEARAADEPRAALRRARARGRILGGLSRRHKTCEGAHRRHGPATIIGAAEARIDAAERTSAALRPSLACGPHADVSSSLSCSPRTDLARLSALCTITATASIASPSRTAARPTSPFTAAPSVVVSCVGATSSSTSAIPRPARS